MGTYTPALSLALLAALSTAEAAASPTGSSRTATEVRITFSRSPIFALSVDVQALTESFCENSEVLPIGQCHIVDEGAFPIGGEAVLLDPVPRPREDPQLLRWQATAMDVPGESVMTSCGPWDVSLRLDPTIPQPISSMILKPGAEYPERGLFAGILEMNFRLGLANQVTGQAVDYPLGLDLGMTGFWNLTASGDQPTQTLSLTVDGNCIPASSPYIDEFLEEYLVGECLCFEQYSPDL